MYCAAHIRAQFDRHIISTVYGCPAHRIMPRYDALVDDVGELHAQCRYEQACALSADGYARASGEIGVCIATSGPGATNLITGVANAYMDSIPMLVIDRKSTRLNSSHVRISYAVFCLKKKKNQSIHKAYHK